MSFIKTNRTEVYENIQQNILMMWHSIHDEIDFIIDEHLLEGITKRLSEICSAKNVFDKIGTGWINYVFDIEYDPDGSFIPSKSIDTYANPSNKEELNAINSNKESYSKVSYETINLEVDSFNDFKPYIDYSIKGKYVKLTVKSLNKTITSKYPISNESIERFISEYSKRH